MEKIRENCAGIDIGAASVFVSVEELPVVRFLSFTEDFYKLRDYLLENRVTSVAMEATGVYWVILYDILQEAGIDTWLVDGRQTKQVPGRKTDVKDCQWIQQIHSYGLLNRCYVAEGSIQELRSYMRLRDDHIRSSAMHVNQMQKALTLMNIRLKEVISQIHGKSGLAIIEAILSGERDKNILIQLCHKSILKTKKDEVLKSLEGKYSEAHLFALKQAYESYMFYKNMISKCDEQINTIINKMGQADDKNQQNTPRKPIRHHKPEVDNLSSNLLKIFGNKDATNISGITDYTWLQLLSETGYDLNQWNTEKHFTSWLGLAPGHNSSGKIRKRAKKKGHPCAGQIFRTIAQSLINSKTIALGAFGRRLRARKGPRTAIKAMARKLAETYWRMMVKGTEYAEFGVKNYEEQLLKQRLKSAYRLANELDLQLIPYQDVV